VNDAHSFAAEPAAPRDLRGAQVTLMGLGLFGGGVETARWLARAGARVRVTDLRAAGELAESLAALHDVGLELALGGHREDDFTRADLVVANPAVAPSNPFLAAARAAGVPVTSEAALFLEACPARLALVTGTQGKSSTSQFTHQLLQASGMRAHLGGNIGRSLLADLEHLQVDDVVVMELSSYQLEALPRELAQRPRTAAVGVVNVLADHLERHGSIADYEAAKRRILELAGDETWVVLNGDDPRTGTWCADRGRLVRYTIEGRAGCELELRGERFWRGSTELGAAADVRVPGRFQRSNVLCALGLALAAGAEPGALRQGLGRLAGLEHRLQDLGLFAGHRVWDNGVSTTPDSTLSAVLELEGPLALLVGGQAKNLPLDELATAARGRVRRVVAFGGSSAPLARAFGAAGVPAEAAGDLPSAVARAFAWMDPGEALLFSPACASFDAYRNFRDRARAFRAALPVEHRP
jgi:UDP-N-acetylmuramoylalanine--D-glutamate ligase